MDDDYDDPSSVLKQPDLPRPYTRMGPHLLKQLMATSSPSVSFSSDSSFPMADS
jgi:hypothetical protein